MIVQGNTALAFRECSEALETIEKQGYVRLVLHSVGHLKLPCHRIGVKSSNEIAQSRQVCLRPSICIDIIYTLGTVRYKYLDI